MARDRNINIVLRARDEASKVFENVANNTLPQFAKRVAQSLTAFASVAAVEETLRRSIGAALDAEKATAGVAAALRAQGAGAVDALPGLKANAEALSRLAIADDEAIQGAQKVLITVGGLLGPELDRATKAALDLAAGLGIDLLQASEMVAKAAQGSIGTFTKLGFEFGKNATDGEKLETVLAGIQSRFGGLAAAEIDTTAGQIHELNEAMGELLETMGTNIVGGASNLSSFTKILHDLNDEATKGQGFWAGIGLLFNSRIGPAGLAEHVKQAADNAAKLAENMAEDRMENPALGFSDAVEAARKALADSVALAEKLAKQEEDAAKAAEKRAAAMQKLRDEARAAMFVGGTSGLGAIANQGPADLDAAARDAASRVGFPTGGLSSGASPFAGITAESVQAQLDAWEELGLSIAAGDDELIEFNLALERSRELSEELAATMQNAVANAATQLGSTLVDAAFGAKVAWRDTVEDILKGLAKAIVQAYILKAVETAFAFSGGGVVGGAVNALSGGGVAGGPVYAAGGFFKPRGTDTVPAMLTPGEMVIPRGASQKILGGRASLVPTGGGGDTFNIFAMDGVDVERVLSRHPRALRNSLNHMGARGY